MDLLAAARRLKTPVSVLYQRHYSLGLFSEDRDDWLRMVALKIQKPCPFLEDDLCGIYPVRPLPCILFPEYLAAEGKFEANARKEHFRDYLCFRSPLTLSPERTRIMVRLKRMWERESLITAFHLFGHGSCRLDFGNLTGELLEAVERSGGGMAEGGLEPGGAIPNRVMELFFLEHLAQCPPFAGMEEKLGHLQTQGGQERFLRLMQDERLFQKLRREGDDRALVFRFAKGKLQAKQRSLLPPEYKFY